MTSNLMALLANIHRGKGKRPYRAEEFNPFAPKPKKAKSSIQAFRVFLPKKNGEVHNGR